MFGERLPSVRVVAYARLSKDDRDKSETQRRASLEAQKTAMRAHCEAHNLVLIATCEDLDRANGSSSGKHMDRPGLQAALQMVREGQADGLLIYSIDRLTRSLLDWQYLLQDYFIDGAKHPATLHSVVDFVDTRSANGRMVMNMIVMFAQWYRETISEKTKAALAYKRSIGIRGGRPGWFENPANVVLAKKLCRRKIAEGLSDRALAELLNEEGVLRPTATGFAPWTREAVKDWIYRVRAEVVDEDYGEEIAESERDGTDD